MVLDELDALKKQHKSILCENEQKTEKVILLKLEIFGIKKTNDFVIIET